VSDRFSGTWTLNAGPHDIKGSLVMRLQGSQHFLGTVHGDGHKPFDVVTVRK